MLPEVELGTVNIVAVQDTTNIAKTNSESTEVNTSELELELEPEQIEIDIKPPTIIQPNESSVNNNENNNTNSTQINSNANGDDQIIEIVSDSENHASQGISIYDLYSRKRKYLILIVGAATSLILPFCDTVYLPALPSIQSDFNTSASLVSLSVSVYLLAIGVFALFWGNFCDRYGRRISLLISLLMFVAITIVCLLSPNITVLVIFRALQGAVIAGILPTGQSAISDIFALHERGMALGLFTIPLLVGPILGPLVGGGLSQSLGWRSTFVALLILGGVFLILVFFLIPETHHYYVLNRKNSIAKGKDIIEAQDIKKPVTLPFYDPLLFLGEKQLLSHVLVLPILFMTMFIAMVELPIVLAEPPYNLSETLTGVCFVPTGLGMLVGCVTTGRLSDYASLKFKPIEGRLFYSCFIGWLTPISALIFGWSFQYQTSMAVPLVFTFVLGFGCSSFFPALMAYVSEVKKGKAAAGTSLVNFLMFVLAGVGVSVASIIQAAIGIGALFSIVAGLCVLVLTIECVVVYTKMKSTPSINVLQSQSVSASN